MSASRKLAANVRIQPLTPPIGASVTGLDLNQPVDEATFADLRQAFLNHCVLVFRGAHLGPRAQVEFARLWGTPAQQNPLLKQLSEFPEIVQVTKVPKETASTEAWHYDSCYTPKPPKLSILSAIRVPVGGDTMWCN